MPSKHTIRQFTENSYYHIFNRGVEKRRIFQDREDYNTFIYYLRIYLSDPKELNLDKEILRLNLENHNLSNEVDLYAFCLMPNHFHLLLSQKNKDSISKLMKQISNAYTQYFNKRNQRVGPLFQGKFKASKVSTDEYILHLSRYIHLNPIGRGASLSEFEWSSYMDYLGKEKRNWVKTDFILNYFKENSPDTDYRKFVEEDKNPNQIPTTILIEE